MTTERIFNLTANGSTESIRPATSHHLRDADPQLRQFMTWGTFGGGTLTIQYSYDGTNWIDDSVLVFSEAGVGEFETKPSLYFRATLTGATSPDISVLFT